MFKTETLKTPNTGLGLACKLIGLFTVLKVFGAISWSWMWVVSPLWIPVALVVSLILLVWAFNFLVK